MTSQPLLAHLAARFVAQRENLATEALAFIFANSLTARGAAIRRLRSLGLVLPDDLIFRTQAASTDDAIPDLVGDDAAGIPRLIIEAKFWAGLTAAQPVLYIKRLQRPGGGGLVFLVPQQRVEIVWHQILTKSRDAGLPISEQESSRAGARLAKSGSADLCIVSWTELLASLLSELEGAGEQVGAANVRQLIGLCEREEADAFLPFSSEELTGTAFPRRVMQISELTEELTKRLVQGGVADVARLKAQGGKGWFGKYLRLRGVGCLLHFSAGKWADQTKCERSELQ